MELTFVAAVVVTLLAAWAAFVALLWLLRPRSVRLGDAVRIVPDVVRLVRSLIADRQAPLAVRAALVGLLVWLVSPVDVVPEFVPIIGPLDDIVVAVLVLRYVRRRLGTDELRRRWPGTAESYELLTAILR